MFDELRELYQEVILDHGKNPRNFRAVENANRSAHGNNPVCGDMLVVYLSVDEDDIIRDVAFQGQGCAISVASASMMTELLVGKKKGDAERLYSAFHDMCTKDDFDPAAAEGCEEDDLDRLQMLSGVKEFPIRVKCATLAWHTMEAAMNGSSDISTE